MQGNKSISRQALLLLLMLLTMGSCYHRKPVVSDAFPVSYSARQLDSISFYSRHHYSQNFNFVVKADSLVLLRQQPEEAFSQLLATDSLTVHRHDHLVVADIRMLPTDSIDSVWVQVARDQHTIGWVHESSLLASVDPDDPISQFISTFSDVHLLIFLIIIVVIGFVYLMRKMLRGNARIVHFNDIDSFYPTLLVLLVASAATFYASIQTFAPEVWRHFYFHPTLNPFATPLILSVFLISIWAILIVGLAAADDVRHQLPLGEAVVYLCGLAAVCAVDYIIFSLTTLYYIGYLLLVAYLYFALQRYFRYSRAGFYCGNCGAKLHEKGCCPHCGAENL